jgi:hypothetical protein
MSSDDGRDGCECNPDAKGERNGVKTAKYGPAIKKTETFEKSI